uniref:Reverse transcriptase/retrotransposon-derived protein RNase H-like domain-containing protein n=1 Tax=Monopterus albus TaxID=43700 RepID=A0A3Q3R6L1_MONAL
VISHISTHNYGSALVWNTQAENAFVDIKQALSHACSLHAPDYSQAFHLDVDEKDSIYNAVLFKRGDDGGGSHNRKVWMHYSAKLDNVERGHPTCVRHVAAIVTQVRADLTSKLPEPQSKED